MAGTDDVAEAQERSARRCECCWTSVDLGIYQGHVLCPHCTINACPDCWRAAPLMRWGKFRLRYRMVCPRCNWKGEWMR